MSIGDWQIRCDRQTLDKCLKDEKFPYIVALARAVNALRFVHTAMRHAGNGDAPEAQRARMNSYLFASAILYEALHLVEAMNKPFRDEPEFQNDLRLLLRDKTVRELKQVHLNPVRNNAVFHFEAERFAETLRQTISDGCIFLVARGNPTNDVHYSFADIVAGEILVGSVGGTEVFYSKLETAMVDTRTLLKDFLERAEKLINHHLAAWGFQNAVVSQRSA
ncbi:MAG TPA: hypothetical protein VKD23_01515 [Terriglobales bacterium]|nr:hypothetical protein [Terriglobales bacterium]